MKRNIMSLVMLVAFAVCGCSEKTNSVVAENVNEFTDDAISVFIVYDGSGSMGDTVMNASGQKESKCIIASRALLSVGNRLNAYLAGNTNRTIGVGMVLLRNGRVTLTDYKVINGETGGFFTKWVSQYGTDVSGGTPLGNAVMIASENLAKLNGVKSKHVLILTDGMSNIGPAPEEVISKFQKIMKTRGDNFGVHLIAFDTANGLFDSLKKMDVTVVEASNEKQLNEKFDFILSEKILLEREE